MKGSMECDPCLNKRYQLQAVQDRKRNKKNYNYIHVYYTVSNKQLCENVCKMKPGLFFLFLAWVGFEFFYSEHLASQVKNRVKRDSPVTLHDTLMPGSVLQTVLFYFVLFFQTYCSKLLKITVILDHLNECKCSCLLALK